MAGLPEYCATHDFKEFLELLEEAPKECTCTNPVHGGKLWKCNTEECKKIID